MHFCDLTAGKCSTVLNLKENPSLKQCSVGENDSWRSKTSPQLHEMPGTGATCGMNYLHSTVEEKGSERQSPEKHEISCSISEHHHCL